MKTNIRYTIYTYICVYIYIYILLHLAHFFLEREMLQTKVVEKIKTRILCSVTFFEIVPFMR
jgi:hypothetical protein